jgi:hypothetical protein
MMPFLVVLLAFGAWWLIGLALLALVSADTSSLRIALTAPALGTSVTVLPLFMFSHFGAGMSTVASPVVAALIACSAAILAWRRPPIPRTAGLIVGICVVYTVFISRPMFEFGFHWIAAANDDMANYVLSATGLLHHGLLAPYDVAGLTNDRNFSSALQGLHIQGSRPGADITLSAFSAIGGHPPYSMFMPCIIALSLCTICGVAALAMQATSRERGAVIAAVLMAAAPLTAYPVFQQLMPQVWGLGLAAALFALLMRPELHTSPGPRVPDLVPIAVLVTAFIVTYVELAASLAFAYGLYALVLLVKRKVAWRALLLLWGVPLLTAVVLLNSYFLREIDYVRSQAGAGVKGGGTASLFGFSLVPAALPSVIGIELLPPKSVGWHLTVSIVIAIVVLAAIAVACIVSASRGSAAATVLAADLLLGIILGAKGSDFGAFKLYMYVQPFLAAAVGVWFAALSRRAVVAGGAALLTLVLVAQVRNVGVLVHRSRDPVDLAGASSAALLPAFRSLFAAARTPVISITENPSLAKLEASSAGSRPIYFIGGNYFTNLLGAPTANAAANADARRIVAQDGWKPRTFKVFSSKPSLDDPFLDNTHASRILSGGQCILAVVTGAEVVFNRRTYPEGARKMVGIPCGGAKNLLAFTSSTRGQGFYIPRNRKAVSFYQLEPDYFFPGRSMSGFGRYILMRVIGPTDGMRLELSLTKSLRQDGSNALPPASIVGSNAVRLPFVGRGSGRVFSGPIKPQMIDGQPFILLDMGQPGRLPVTPRSGVQALYGSSLSLDPRYLTSYVRDVSLVSSAEYAHLRPPSLLREFPRDLGNEDLAYSGIYEDGWVAETSYAMLAAGPRADLVVRASVLPVAKHLVVLVDGKPVYSRDVAPGKLDLRIPVAASTSRRRVGLKWRAAAELGPTDKRPASALLTTLGFTARATP